MRIKAHEKKVKKRKAFKIIGGLVKHWKGQMDPKFPGKSKNTWLKILQVVKECNPKDDKRETLAENGKSEYKDKLHTIELFDKSLKN